MSLLHLAAFWMFSQSHPHIKSAHMRWFSFIMNWGETLQWDKNLLKKKRKIFGYCLMAVFVDNHLSLSRFLSLCLFSPKLMINKNPPDQTMVRKMIKFHFPNPTHYDFIYLGATYHSETLLRGLYSLKDSFQNMKLLSHTFSTAGEG